MVGGPRGLNIPRREGPTERDANRDGPHLSAVPGNGETAIEQKITVATVPAAEGGFVEDEDPLGTMDDEEWAREIDFALDKSWSTSIADDAAPTADVVAAEMAAAAAVMAAEPVTMDVSALSAPAFDDDDDDIEVVVEEPIYDDQEDSEPPVGVESLTEDLRLDDERNGIGLNGSHDMNGVGVEDETADINGLGGAEPLPSDIVLLTVPELARPDEEDSVEFKVQELDEWVGTAEPLPEDLVLEASVPELEELGRYDTDVIDEGVSARPPLALVPDPDGLDDAFDKYPVEPLPESVVFMAPVPEYYYEPPLFTRARAPVPEPEPEPEVEPERAPERPSDLDETVLAEPLADLQDDRDDPDDAAVDDSVIADPIDDESATVRAAPIHLIDPEEEADEPSAESNGVVRPPASVLARVEGQPLGPDDAHRLEHAAGSGPGEEDDPWDEDIEVVFDDTGSVVVVSQAGVEDEVVPIETIGEELPSPSALESGGEMASASGDGAMSESEKPSDEDNALAIARAEIAALMNPEGAEVRSSGRSAASLVEEAADEEAVDVAPSAAASLDDDVWLKEGEAGLDEPPLFSSDIRADLERSSHQHHRPLAVVEGRDEERARIESELTDRLERLASMTHYEVLELDPEADEDQIRNARAHLESQFHPDRWTPDLLTARARRLSEQATLLVRRAADQLLSPTERTRYDRAIGVTIRPAQADPFEAELAYLEGQAAAQRNETDDAERKFRRAIEKAPSEGEYIAALAEALASRDALDEAATLLRRASDLSPASRTVTLANARLRLRRSDTQGALDWYGKVLKIDPDCHEAREFLAGQDKLFVRKVGLLSRLTGFEA